MKTLLFLLAFLPLSLMGQESIKTRWFPPEDTIRHKIDTVAVWMNCAKMDDRGLPSYNITMKGWEVRTPKWIPAHWDENDAYIRGHLDIEKTYLNHFKQPLTGYIVWQTKEIK